MSDTLLPPPVENDDRKNLAWKVLDRAITRWREANQLVERSDAEQSQPRSGDQRLEPWLELETEFEVGAAIEAERHLIRAILLTSPSHYWQKTATPPEKFRWPNRGLIYGEKIYLAIVDSSSDHKPGGFNDVDLMKLVVMDRAAIIDMTEGIDLDQIAPEPIASPVDEIAPTAPDSDAMMFAKAMSLGMKETYRRLFQAPNPIADETSTESEGGPR